MSGFCSDNGWQPDRVIVSPRNAEKASALAESFPDLVTVGATNQDVVSASSVVFIGLLPEVAKEVHLMYL